MDLPVDSPSMQQYSSDPAAWPIPVDQGTAAMVAPDHLARHRSRREPTADRS